MTNPEKLQPGAPALEKGLDLLEALAGASRGLSQKQLAERVGRSVGEIFRMLVALERRGYVARDPVTGGPTSTLTHDGISGWPLWGPQGQIVFVKQLNAKGRKYGPKNDLFLMNANGKGVKRLTHTVVGDLVSGLFPTAWSASGNQLLAEFGGQDTSYAVAVNPKTGKETNLSPDNSETGFAGVALTPDGKTALGYIGGWESAGTLKIASVPYTGGKPKVILTGGFNPSWGG